MTEGNEVANECDYFLAVFGLDPVEPIQVIILTVSVVVALLRMSDLVPHEDHGDALAEHQDGECVFDLTAAQRHDVRIIGGPLNAAVPRVIVVGAIVVVLAVGLVVLVVLAEEIPKGEAVVTGDEVH